MSQAYKFLNTTKPNHTRSCWLCYDIWPPFYEGIAIMGQYNTTTDPHACWWNQEPGSKGLTLQSVSGQGLCIGPPPRHYRILCNVTQPINSTRYHLPPQDSWWACSEGLTPCAHGQVINRTGGFCVLVQLLPRIIYHSDEQVLQWMDLGTHGRNKREPISAVTIATLLGIGLAGAGTGIASLATQASHYSSLRAAIDVDIECIGTSISHLQESLTSLSEVVLQNRRGLDLIFLQQGGICAALNKECCSYTDHSGIVAKVREGLARRKREREQQQGWFESWFNHSAWLTTLSSLASSFLLLLLLTFGPCPINRLMGFVRDQVNTVQLMVLRQHYQPLNFQDS
ncbi:unnamed protein product [Nyctereutes procyonoides]|uniref:(raccoon dog) hypothetical protein n=1 Tax=Nyctereutes procyonoides TaxID=34880 RepID=A0A811YWJ9_NYCPR|nr:unnamed protein product [Nyctereutes procyonoides]